MSQLSHRNTPSPAPYLKTDQLRIERRKWARTLVEQTVTAVYHDESRMGVARMEIVDSSVTGLGARTNQKLAEGMHIKLTAPGVNLPTRSGTVVRCVSDGEKFSVGIRLDKALAA